MRVLSLDPFIIENDPLAFLDGSRVFATEQSRKLLPLALRFVEEVEKGRGNRSRRRTAVAEHKMRDAVEAILAEVCYQHLLSPRSAVHLPLGAEKVSAKSRYKPSFLGKTYLQALDLMSDPTAGLIELERGYKNPFNGPDVQSSVRAGWRLASTVQFLGLTVADFSRDWRKLETIILRDKPKGRSTWRKPGKELEYDDTPETVRYREELREINDWLSDGDIECVAPHEVDIQQCSLRRIFNETFSRGGRLFGAFWLQMSKDERRRRLRIQGELTVSLDFAQFNPRAAYGIKRLLPDFEDAYHVPHWERTASRRSNAKIVMNQLLSADRIPQRQPEENWDDADPMPYRQLRDDLMDFHLPIRDLFGEGIGHRLSFMESQTMVACLLEMKRKGIVGLPVHDCLIVPESAAAYGAQLMRAKAKEVTGVEIQVKAE